MFFDRLLDFRLSSPSNLDEEFNIWVEGDAPVSCDNSNEVFEILGKSIGDYDAELIFRGCVEANF